MSVHVRVQLWRTQKGGTQGFGSDARHTALHGSNPYGGVCVGVLAGEHCQDPEIEGVFES